MFYETLSLLLYKNLTDFLRYYAIHEYARTLGEEVCRALPLWFTFTGCDTVSMFAGRGKITAWNVWNVYPDVTGAFVR